MPPSRAKVALVGAPTSTTEALVPRLEDAGYDVHTFPIDADGLARLERDEPDVAVVRIVEAPADGVEWIRQAHERSPYSALVGVVLSDAEWVARAVRAGAETCVFDSANPDALVPVIDLAREKARVARDAARFRRRAEESLSMAKFETIVGRHPAMRRLLQKVAHVARTRATVLIHGESGTGKELIAAAIHQNSKRSSGPFVRLNCAALSESILESELFGHEKGAFTGAAGRRDGRFSRAAGGTLFLDEVSEIPKAIQVKLLRFLQEREFERVGGNETIRVDARIVAATNRELRPLVEDGTFRDDLYYRLNVVRIDVPPLRARPSDILLLADHFLRESARENEVVVAGFSDAATRALLDYPWPGNVRELQNAVEQAVVLAEGGEIDAGDLPLTAAPPEEEALRIMIPGATMLEVERYAILQTLKALGGSITRAAGVLGISRRTIQYRLKEWGVADRTSGYSLVSGMPSRGDGEAGRDPT